MKKRENFIEGNKNTLTVGIQVEIREEEGYFIAYCPALELSSFAQDLDTAKKRFVDEVAIFIVETKRKGTLEKYLLKMGWTLREKPVPSYIPPKITIPPQLRQNTFMEDIAIPVC